LIRNTLHKGSANIDELPRSDRKKNPWVVDYKLVTLGYGPWLAQDANLEPQPARPIGRKIPRRSRERGAYASGSAEDNTLAYIVCKRAPPATPWIRARTMLRHIPAAESVRADTSMTGTVTFLFGLRELIRLELYSATLIEYLVDLAGSPGALEVMDNHVSIVSQESLPAFCLCWACHSFSQFGVTTVIMSGKVTSHSSNNHSQDACFIVISTISL
jgi:hypothetical protein